MRRGGGDDDLGVDPDLNYGRYWRDLFWLIDRFIRDRRLANLLKILVVLVCLASILQRLLPTLGIGF